MPAQIKSEYPETKEAGNVDGIPATYLLDKNGNIIANGLCGDAMDKAVESAERGQ